jgi:restriction endonuclease
MRSFFLNESRYYLLEDAIKHINDPYEFTKVVQDYNGQLFSFKLCLAICLNTCKRELSISRDISPEKKIALYFMQAEFHTRSSVLAMDERDKKSAYDHYESAIDVLSTAVDYHHKITDQGYSINEDILKKSNSYGLTNPIEAISQVQRIIKEPLNQLMQFNTPYLTPSSP